MSSIENTIPSPEHESNIANQEEETEVTVTADKTDPFEDNPFENDPFEDDPFEDEQNTFPTTTTNTTATTTDTDNLNDDEFGDFDDDFQDAENDDGFGDFDDFEPTEQPDISLPATPTQADEFIKVLEAASAPDEIADYVHGFLENMWPQDQLTTPELLDSDGTTDIICTECSHGLWDKLSCDSVFYNPMTGAIGQFQWTQSETNRAYLNALGVTINYDDASSCLLLL
ncbi:hypothetical protein DFQ29_000713 [Apophysomyces sp. BC1021]|nr:hypothetical protein DFQ29_000713 [Apophysomyces sp. BC1021]